GQGIQSTCSSANASPCGARSTGSSNAASGTWVSPAQRVDSKNTFAPHTRQNERFVPGDDSYATRSSAPASTVTCGDLNPTQVTTPALCDRRQLSQWQCAQKRDGKRAVKRTRPHMQRPRAALGDEVIARGGSALRR